MECHYVTFGCKMTLATERDVQIHKRSCRFGPAECPRGCAELLRQHELAAHVCHDEDDFNEDDVERIEELIRTAQAPKRGRDDDDAPDEAGAQGRPDEVFECPVPGCGSVARKLLGTHSDSSLRHHMELLGRMALPLTPAAQQAAQAVLLDALKWFPADLCCRCKEAEGDTRACSICHRYMHEDCDAGNLRRGVCADCHDVRRELYAIEPPRERMEVNVEGRVDDLDDCDDDEEEDDDGPDDADEPDLSGFVVDDDHVSFSSDVSASRRSSASPVATSHARMRKPLPPKRAFVLESSDSVTPAKRDKKEAKTAKTKKIADAVDLVRVNAKPDADADGADGGTGPRVQRSGRTAESERKPAGAGAATAAPKAKHLPSSSGSSGSELDLELDDE